MKFVDDFLNSITMYRLILYGLLLMAAISTVLAFIGLLPFSGFQLTISAIALLATCYSVNRFLSLLYKAPRNSESALITALILFFVLVPANNSSTFLTLLYASALAMGSKYILAIRSKHIFNPAAISLVILGLLGVSASAWWIASPSLSPFVIVVGFLIVRKLRRFSMIFSFTLAALISIAFSGYLTSGPIFNRLFEIFTAWPLIYFADFMLTEPRTTPPTKYSRMIYGAIVGIFFGWQFRIGPIYSTPELALVLGNIFSYLVSSKQMLKLQLQKKTGLGADIYDFSFAANQKLKFMPGQYLEWTLPYPHPDSRGNRRYFTVASSPTEKEIKLGVKITSDHSSGFKKSLSSMNEGDEIFAAQLAGDFVLPQDKNAKLAFVAGGIGITPYRSMVKYLLDNNQRRDVVLFYSSATPDGFVYKELLDKAEKLGVKTVYVLTAEEKRPANWDGELGRLTPELIKKYVPDYQQRVFYLSGPEAMVTAYKKLLLGMGVGRKNIVTDYFPGY